MYRIRGLPGLNVLFVIHFARRSQTRRIFRKYILLTSKIDVAFGAGRHFFFLFKKKYFQKASRSYRMSFWRQTDRSEERLRKDQREDKKKKKRFLPRNILSGIIWAVNIRNKKKKSIF